MAGITGTPAFLINMLTFATVYAILALGLNLQWGHTGLFNISVAAFWGVGAYTAVLVARAPDAPTAFGLNAPFLWIDVAGVPIPFPAAVVIAAVVSGVIAALIGVPTLRLRTDYLAIATLGLAEIIRLILLNEAWLAGGGQGLSVQNPITGMEYDSLILLVVALITLAISYAVVERTTKSPWGRVLRSIREDEDVAEALGKNTFGYKMQSMVIGSMIMGAAGAITALQINFLIPQQFNPEWTFFIWIAVIVGGSGSNKGALLGGVFLTVLLEGPRFVVDYVPPGFGNVVTNFRLLLFGTVLIVIMTYRPQGFLGDRDVMEQGE